MFERFLNQKFIFPPNLLQKDFSLLPLLIESMVHPGTWNSSAQASASEEKTEAERWCFQQPWIECRLFVSKQSGFSSVFVAAFEGHLGQSKKSIASLSVEDF